MIDDVNKQLTICYCANICCNTQGILKPCYRQRKKHVSEHTHKYQNTQNYSKTSRYFLKKTIYQISNFTT